MKINVVLVLFIQLCLIASFAVSPEKDLQSSVEEEAPTSLRRRLLWDPRSTKKKSQSAKFDWSEVWCRESPEPPLPYDVCNATDVVYRIPLYGGMTNALKLVLLGAILAFEENRCFFVDESQSDLNIFDKFNPHDNGFIQRYFAKIGLSNQDPIIMKALEENRLRSLTWKELWQDTRVRRMYQEVTSLKSLGYHYMENHQLKKIMMRRMWRPRPEIRDRTCKALLDYGLQEDFMTFSIRRGDKSTELFNFVTMKEYIEAAEEAIKTHFHGQAPTIFVATDDCTVLPTLRTVRPQWKFVSECDKAKQDGFALRAMSQWTHAETDAHFAKFFVELYAMAVSRYFIGVAYTNVAWWAFFMRPDRESFRLLDMEDGGGSVINAW